MENKKIPLKVTPKPNPNTRAVIDRQGEGTIAFKGDADCPDLACGNCGSSLVVGVLRNRIGNMVIRCNSCGSYNDIIDIGIQ